MRFHLTTNPSRHQVVEKFPTAVMWRDNWNDYGYKTTFWVKLHLAPDEAIDLEAVKICSLGQGDRTELPDETFVKLDETYCSLGQKYSYYEMLYSLGPAVYEPYLRGMQDMVYLPEVRDRFVDERCVEVSLLRFDAAISTFEDAPKLFAKRGSRTRAQALEFRYEAPSMKSGESIGFAFGDHPDLPTRLSVLIGYNGAGKTRLLADLAMLAYADRTEAAKPDFVMRHGVYRGDSPQFGAILAISYSAFDDFKIPGEGGGANARLERQRAKAGQASPRSYRYCGLRQVDKTGKASTTLKSIEQLTLEFHQARRRALEKDRLESLRLTMDSVLAEPSIKTIADLPELDAADSVWKPSFARLSTGHKIVLNIVVQLCAYLERRSIVLVDEPELHLHPPLLAALLRAIGAALEWYDSFGILATHSPVVLQEVPARQVTVLRRYFDLLTVEAPEIETFGENVGLLTKYAFNLDSKDTDYRGTIEGLAHRYDLGAIEELFEGRMSEQARSLVVSMQLERDGI